MVFYESNPWNPFHKLCRGILRLVGKRDPRNLVSRSTLYQIFQKSALSVFMRLIMISSLLLLTAR